MTKELDKKTFTQLYINEGMSLRKIADMYGRSYMFAHHRKTKYGIPKRNTGTKKIEIDETTLWELYVKEEKSVSEITKVFDCSVGPIYRKIKRGGLEKE